MRLRLREERKLWDRADGKTRARWLDMEDWEAKAVDNLANYALIDPAGDQASSAAAVGHLTSFLQAAQVVCTIAADLQHILAVECTTLQYLILGLLKQNEVTRRDIISREQSIVALRSRISGRLLDGAAQVAWQRPRLLWKGWTDNFAANVNPAQIDQSMRQSIDNISAMKDDVLPKIASTRQMLTDIQAMIDVCT